MPPSPYAHSGQSQSSRSPENAPSSIMGDEINADSIRDLERQIEEGTGDIIQFKRTRNALLNISVRVPPEILGSIFCWSIATDESPQDWIRIDCKFLLVCHHWFEVACRTPELWGFWGITLKQWSHRYQRSGTTPVVLTLKFSSNVSFDGPLREAVRDRAALDLIRSVDLTLYGRAAERDPILSSLTPDGEDVWWCNRMESISLAAMNVSDFFARCRFPNLSHLYLSQGIKITSWEHFRLHTTSLTTLWLTFKNTSPTPTTSQLLSILASNPRLQSLILSKSMIPRDHGDGSTSLVPLHHLTDLFLKGDIHPVFRLLRRLDHPEAMDEAIKLSLSRCTVRSISGILGPYMRDYFQRDGRSRDQLGIFVKSFDDSISIQASTVSTGRRDTFAIFRVKLREELPTPAADKLCIKFVAYTPREHVVYLGGQLSMDAVRGIAPAMPKIQELHLIFPSLSDGFLQPDPDGPLANTKLFPSLRHLRLEHTTPDDDDWTPLLPYLIHQTSGGQAISLTLSGTRTHICKDVVRDIEGLVEEFTLGFILDVDCPFDLCVVDEEDGERQRSVVKGRG